MEEFIKKIWHTAKETATNGLETARSTGLPRKIILVLLGVASCIIVVILFMKALGYLFDSIYSFVNRHFYGVAATAAGGSCIALQYYKKKKNGNGKWRSFNGEVMHKKNGSVKAATRPLETGCTAGFFPPLILVPLPPARDRSVRLTWAIQRLMHTLTGG